MLHSNARRARETAEREAAGDNLWSTEFSKRALVRLDAIWEIVVELRSYDREYPQRIAQYMRVWGGYAVPSELHPGAFVHRSLGHTEFILDLLGSITKVLRDIPGDAEKEFTRVTNSVLNEHRIAFRLVDGEIVPVRSDELHEEVVQPALRLLVGAEFNEAHDAYLKALKEIQRNDSGDAITDAGTALQLTLTALGCKGKVLGDLLRDAKRKNLLAGHDEALTDGIKRIADWSASERNITGDSHQHSTAELSDAWLMVHVVGALIVRLTDPGLARGAQ